MYEVNNILYSWYTVHYHIHNLIISAILRCEWWYFHFTDKETGPEGSVTKSYMESKDLKCEELGHKPQVYWF